MSSEWLSRQISLIGEEASELISHARTAVFGLGGVGGYAAEGLCRAGVGHIALVDRDVFSESNINRQILAVRDTIGRYKAETARERVLSINPDAEVTAICEFVTPDNVSDILDRCEADYVIDAVDNVTAKIALIAECKRRGIYIISCMGTGNKLDSSRFRAADISKTSVCPLARIMRRELGVRSISCDVVFSDEPPIKNGLRTPASISFVPPAAGFILCGEIIKHIIKEA